MHVSGAQLDMYTGVAAVLRRPLVELDEVENGADGAEGDAMTSSAGAAPEGEGEGDDSEEPLDPFDCDIFA